MARFGFMLRVVGLLIGFYVMCVAMIAVLVTADVLVTPFLDHGGAKIVFLLYAVTAAGVFIVVRGVFVSTRVKPSKAPWVRVTERDQPALWARVRDLSRAVGTRAPSRVYLTPEVNAAVWEQAYLLGLVPGRRNMIIGVPLLIGLTPAQLDSVIAHELGHYSGRDTRYGALVGRVSSSVMAAVAAARAGVGGKRKWELPGAEIFDGIFRAYARAVLRVTQPARRAQELAADRVSAQIAGRRNAVAALRELPVLDAAFDFYLDRYVAAGLPAGLLPMPPDVMGGFGHLLAAPERQAELGQVRTNPPSGAPDPYDSHPPIEARIAELEALPEDGRPLESTAYRAVAVLADPAAALSAVGLRLLSRVAPGKRGADWDTVIAAGKVARLEEVARPLATVVSMQAGMPATPGVFLALVESGRLGPVLDALPRSEAAIKANANGRVAREFAITAMQPALEAWLLADLTRAGRITWRHDWGQAGGAMVGPPGLAEAVEAAAKGVCANDPRPLRAVLTGTAVPA